MRVQYVITNDEIQKAQDRLAQLRHVALLSRDAGQTEDNREYYLRAREFSQAIRNKDSDQMWAVMDELMTTLAIVNPRLYDSAMRRIAE